MYWYSVKYAFYDLLPIYAGLAFSKFHCVEKRNYPGWEPDKRRFNAGMEV